jgi:uncharacterized protein YhfF
MATDGSKAERAADASASATTAALRALILTPGHGVVLMRRPEAAAQAWQLPQVPCAADDTRLMERLAGGLRAELGVELGSPCGSRVPPDRLGPREFVFLLPAGVEPRVGSALDHEVRVFALRDALEACRLTGEDVPLWSLYVDRMLGGFEPGTRDLDVFAFGNSPRMAVNLAHLVTCGDKRVTFGWLRAAQHEKTTVPWPGLISLVTDHLGYPRCVIETLEVTTSRFQDVPAALAADEAEGDLSYADWREGHIAYFEREAARLRLAWSEDELVMAERFRVLHVIGRADR